MHSALEIPGPLEGGFLHFQIVYAENKIPIRILHIADNIDNLFLEIEIRNFHIIFRDVYVFLVDFKTEILQQGLCQAEFNFRIVRGIQSRGRGIRFIPAAIEVQLVVRTRQ